MWKVSEMKATGRVDTRSRCTLARSIHILSASGYVVTVEPCWRCRGDDPRRGARGSRLVGADGPADYGRLLGMTDSGGDPACWLSRVCDRCGSLVDDAEPHRCRDSTPDAPAATAVDVEGVPSPSS